MNRIRCFNHTLQLSAKALLRPFSSDKKDDADKEVPLDVDDDDDDDDLGMPALEGVDDDGDNDDEDDEDPFDALSDEEQVELTENTEAVREVITKVCISNIFICILLIPSSFVPLHLPSSTLRRRHFPLGVKSVWPGVFAQD